MTTVSTSEEYGFAILMRDDDTATGHRIPVTEPHPVRETAAVVVDVALRVVTAFVARLLFAASVSVVVVALLAFAQVAAGDRAAAVVMVAVGYLAICGWLVRMGVLEMRRLERVSRRRRP